MPWGIPSGILTRGDHEERGDDQLQIYIGIGMTVGYNSKKDPGR